MKTNLFKINLDIIVLVAFLVVSIFTFISGSQVGYWIAITFAAVGFIIVQQPEKGEEPDERDKFIAHQASTYSFGVVLTALVLFSVFADFVPALSNLPTSRVINGVIIVMYSSFSISYGILKRIH